MIRKLIALLTLLVVGVAAMAQDQDKPKWEKNVSKGVRKTEEKVGTWTKKTSKGFNHAMQRTVRRHAKGAARENTPDQMTTHRRHRRHHRHHRRHRHHRHHGHHYGHRHHSMSQHS